MAECTKDVCMCVSFQPHARHADHCSKCSHPRRLHPGLKQELSFFSPSLLLARKEDRSTPAPGADKYLMPFAKTPYFSQIPEKDFKHCIDFPTSQKTEVPRAQSVLVSEDQTTMSETVRSSENNRMHRPDVQIRGRRKKSPNTASGSVKRKDTLPVKSGRSLGTKALLGRNTPSVEPSRSRSPGDNSTSRSRRIVLRNSHAGNGERTRAVSASDLRFSPYKVRLSRSNTPPPQPTTRVFVVPSPQKSPSTHVKIPLLDIAGMVTRNQKKVVSEYFAGSSIETNSYARVKTVKFEDECLKLYCVGRGHRNTVNGVCMWGEHGLVSVSSDYTVALWTIPKLCRDPYKATAREFQPGSFISPTHNLHAHHAPARCVTSLDQTRYCTSASDSLVKVSCT